MPDYPATSLALNKGKYYVLLTIPPPLREFFNGRKQLKRSTGTSDLQYAKRKQHGISADLYGQLDACKPDVRDVISDLLGWIGDAEEVQRLEDNGDLEGLIQYAKNLEYGENPGNDVAVEVLNENGQKALEIYREWKAGESLGTAASGDMYLSVATDEYLATQPYGLAKTARECEHAIDQFREFAGDVPLTSITAVKVHEFAEVIGKGKSKKTIGKKLGYVRRMFDLAVRKGWVPANVFAGIKLDKNLGAGKQSYVPLTDKELTKLFALEMPDHLRRLLSILITTGMRLDEAALLNWEDVKHNEPQDVTYFDLTEALVKNKGSQRRVPVHPTLSWIRAGKTGQMFSEFPRDRDGKTQSASSKVLMPLIRSVTEEKSKVVHSLRGNFKDMLRDAGVSKEINDFITGHASGDVAGNYGAGPSLKVRKEAIERLELPFILKK